MSDAEITWHPVEPETIDKEHHSDFLKRYKAIKKARADLKIEEPRYPTGRSKPTKRYRSIHLGRDRSTPNSTVVLGDLARKSILAVANSRLLTHQVHVLFENGKKCDKWVDWETGEEVPRPAERGIVKKT